MRKICLLEKEINGVSLISVFKECNLGNIEFVRLKTPADFKDCEGLIIGQGMLDSLTLGKAISNFVYQGGVCWVMHQTEKARVSWLPEKLCKIKLQNRYFPVASGAYNYVGPWITDRNHPLWNKPNYIDEGRFVFWDIKINGKRYRSSASHILWQNNWKVLARFVDYEVKIKDNTAIVMQAPFGKGLFFWTQVFSPQIVLKNEVDFRLPERIFIKNSWKMFIKNIFSYFDDFQKRKLLKVSVEAYPWAVKAEEKVKIKVVVPSLVKIKKTGLEILTPEGKKELFTEDKEVSIFQYIPKHGGTYRVRAKIDTIDNRQALAHTFFKATKRWTPFRFTTHTHYENSSAPDSLGLIFGQARRLGIDAIVLAGYPDTPKRIKEVDHPAVRFFMGIELHCGGKSTPEEGCPPDNPDFRKHASTFGHTDYLSWVQEKWVPENLISVHENRGLAIVCHPYKNSWWLHPQKGHNFEAVEFDRVDTTIWDKKLMQGELVTGVSGLDNLGHFWFSQRGPNIGWFEEPLTLENLFRAILSGRITKMNTFPLPLEAKGSILWFDINHQVVGGTVYAVDKVTLHIRIKSHLPIQQVWVVKGGNRGSTAPPSTPAGQMHFEPDEEEIERFITDKVDGNTYYRWEVNHEKIYASWCVTSLSNPIFVKKVEGPSGAYFYPQNSASPVFNKEEGRWQANFTRIKKVEFNRNIWEIELYEPGNGSLYIGWKEMGKIEVDKKEVSLKKSKEDEYLINFDKGTHRIRIFEI